MKSLLGCPLQHCIDAGGAVSLKGDHLHVEEIKSALVPFP